MPTDDRQAFLEQTAQNRGYTLEMLRADVEQIQAHVRVALQEGASPREILEALQAVIAPMGALAFRRGLQAWAAETGNMPSED